MLLMSLGLLLGCRPLVEPRVPPPPGDPGPAWEAVLGEVVTPDGFVDYEALAARREALDAYVAWVGKPRRTRRAAPRHAFHLNAYNALVLYGVLEAGRPASVRDVGGALPWPGGAFYHQAFLVDGHPTSLWEIEHERLRNRVLDYRDHAALVDGTATAPPLRAELYDPARLEEQLDDQMRRWVMDPHRGVRLTDGEARFPPAFREHAHDFELLTVGADLCTTAARYATGAARQRLRELAAEGCPHGFLAEDPRLNDASLSTGAVPAPDGEPVEGLGDEGPHSDEG